jgi:pectin lyase
VEAFVNGVPLGRSSTPGALLAVGATVLAGQENLIALRATGGSATAPQVLAELEGAFGRVGTTTRWRVKAATGGEASEANGPWTQLAYDDSSWSLGSSVSSSLPPGFPTGGPAQGLWAGAKEPSVLLRLRLYVPAGLDTATPQGFGRHVTGGAGGPTVRPTTLAELTQALCSSTIGSSCTDTTPRVIEVTRAFDFVGSQGTKTARGCYAYTSCSNPVQSEILLDGQGGCAGKATFDVTYDAAGVAPLLVGSNKTVIGVGGGGVLRGKGLTLRGGVSNIVIRNLTITTLNPQIVWGGDALTIDNADRVWVDHNRFSLIGRQMFVTGWGKASNVTFSWNELDGQTPYAAYCDGSHYWVSLNLGSADTITFLGNWVHHTSGRGPHVGGYAGVNVVMHLIDNLYERGTGHAINPTSSDGTMQSRLLVEANHFTQVTRPVFIDGTPGLIYAPVSDEAGCRGTLGRVCAANIASPAPSSGWTPPLDAAALSGVASASAGALPEPFPATEVPHVVPHLAGVGHL